MSLQHKLMFGDPIAPWHLWFAWRPVKTWDGRWCWFSVTKRRMIQSHDYLSGPSMRWWEYEIEDGYALDVQENPTLDERSLHMREVLDRVPLAPHLPDENETGTTP